MIHYKQIDRTSFELYDRIPMRVNVESYFKVEKLNRGLGGFLFIETPVEPYLKDFCKDNSENAALWEKQFDIANWAFFMAFDEHHPVGACTVAARTKGVQMLEGREDLAVLWDIRVDDGYKRQGIGKKLFELAAGWSRSQGYTQMKIECQNNNVPAVKFYHRQGAVLYAVNEYAYCKEPEFRHEIQLIWYLNLS